MGWAGKGHYGPRQAKLGRPILGLDGPGWAGPAQPSLAWPMIFHGPCRAGPAHRPIYVGQSSPLVFMGWAVS